MSASAPITPDELLALVVDQTLVGMSVHDDDGRCLMMNAVSAAFSGVEACDVIGRRVSDYAPAIADELNALFERTLASGSEVRSEVYVDTATSPGHVRRWTAKCRPIAMGDGRRLLALIVDDTTDQRGENGALTASERELRAIFERLDHGFCVCDIVVDDHGRAVDYRFLDTNSLFEEMTGLSDVIGRTALDVVPDLEAYWIDTYGRVALERESVRFEQGSDAMGRWFDVFATPLSTRGRFSIVFRDVTAARAARADEEEMAERYREMADDLPLMVWVQGPDGAQQYVNLTFCEYFGVDRDRMTESVWEVLVHPDDVESYVASFERAIADTAPFHEQVRVMDGAGGWRWLESWGQPRFDRDGTFLGHLGASADVTDRVMTERSLAEAMTFMRSVLDSLFAFVGVLEPDGTLIEANAAPLELAGITIDDVRGKKFWDCHWWNHDDEIAAELERSIARAATGEVVRYDVQVRIANDERVWIDFQIVPLRAPDGTITHLVPSGLDIGERIAADDERSRLLAEERERRHRAECLEEHAVDLAAAVGPHDIARVTAEHVQEWDGLHVAVLNLLRDDDIELIGGLARDAPASSRVALDDDRPGQVAIVTNEPFRLSGRRAIVERFPHLAEVVDSRSLESLAAFPLRASDRSAIGALVVGSSESDTFHGSTLSLLHGIAEQTGAALERALLHERLVEVNRRQREIAVRLQRALLPDQLVQRPDVAIAARYQAAGDHLEVGGDWYDSFEWESGEIGLMVGDVVGHDLEAAAAMGRVRAAVAALAPRLEPDPAEVLGALEQIVRGRNGTSFATAACVVLDPRTGVVRVSTAGHPPPVLVCASVARLSAPEQIPPLGTFDVEMPPAEVVQLEPGDRVILYSDGLVERRGEALDVGLDRLRSACEECADEDSERYLDAVVAAMTADGIDDDVVVLAMRWQPSR